MDLTFTDEQQLLTLALVSYQGILLPHLAGTGDAPAADRITDALDTLVPLQRQAEDDPSGRSKGRWAMVWGPASHRPSVGLIDDALMFVARDRDNPTRFAVVIRGTNPASMSDWVFGDLWTSHDIAWRYGDDRQGARISLSTSLGLSVLQGLRTTRYARNRGHITAILGAGLDALLGPIGQALDGPLAALRDEVRGLARDLLPAPIADEADRLEALFVARSSARYAALRTQLSTALAVAEQQVTADVYHLIEDVERLRTGSDPGVDLASFLHDMIPGDGGAIEVHVTGHSKGAAMATAVALWLADTQGLPAGWDPARRATVSCTTFAGPTAGNGPFARRVEAALGDRLQRVANPLDLVTRAWQPDSLAGVATIFAPGIAPPTALAGVAAAVAKEVRPLDYQHARPGAAGIRSELASVPGGFLGQASHQHMEAYLAHAGLTAWLDRERLFGVS